MLLFNRKEIAVNRNNYFTIIIFVQIIFRLSNKVYQQRRISYGYLVNVSHTLHRAAMPLHQHFGRIDSEKLMQRNPLCDAAGSIALAAGNFLRLKVRRAVVMASEKIISRHLAAVLNKICPCRVFYFPVSVTLAAFCSGLDFCFHRN